ncbi:hypothetical protein ASF76_11470 [Microbacterium sp. Leaf151]|nr:hypothetical protein ASF76_11470 [Microbacterium sp. Leaf151]
MLRNSPSLRRRPSVRGSTFEAQSLELQLSGVGLIERLAASLPTLTFACLPLLLTLSLRERAPSRTAQS